MNTYTSGHTLLVCGGVHEDPGTGRQTIREVVDLIGFSSFPAVMGELGLYVRLHRTPEGEAHMLRFRLVLGGEEKRSWRMPIKFPWHPDPVPAGKPKLYVQGSFLTLDLVRFEEPGIYRLELEVDDVEVTHFDLHIVRSSG